MPTRTYIEIIPNPVSFEAQLYDVAAALETTAIPLAASAGYVRDEIVDAFARQRDPNGGNWEPWKESYVEYAESYPNVQLLIQSGDMYAALTDEGAFTVSDDTMIYDPDVPPRTDPPDKSGMSAMRHELHQEGTAKMAARPFIGLSLETEGLIFSAFKEWFDEAIQFWQTSKGRVGVRHQIRGAGGRFVSRASVGKAPLPKRF